MKIRIIVIGKKHEPWVKSGVERFLERLRPPFTAEFEIINSSSREGKAARAEESSKVSGILGDDSMVILLDERGKNISSPELSGLITDNVHRQLVFIIGGAFGVNEQLQQRADFVWSLSNLVFPHQLVRLILAEQLYRAQEISKGSGYHHL